MRIHRYILFILSKKRIFFKNDFYNRKSLHSTALLVLRHTFISFLLRAALLPFLFREAQPFLIILRSHSSVESLAVRWCLFELSLYLGYETNLSSLIGSFERASLSDNFWLEPRNVGKLVNFTFLPTHKWQFVSVG